MEPRLKSDIKKLNVAVVHDVLLEYGGSERVLEELLGMFSKAHLFTLYFNKTDKTIYSAFNKRHPRTSFLQQIPSLYKLGHYFSLTKLLSWIYFYFLNLSGYDLVISSSHSYSSKMVRKPKNSFHICYLHTPPKYLYKETSEIGWIKKFPFNSVLLPVISFLRFLDRKAVEHPDLIITNSKEVKKRVSEYYKRDSLVVYPPVNVPKKLEKKGKGKYFLALSRLIRQKGIELAVETCTRHNLPLVVVGEGYLKARLEKMAGSTVTFRGRVSDEKMSDIYAKAKALVYCAREEDFGIVPVEAMGHGLPVIAYHSGGVGETVIDGKTGVLFDMYNEEGLYKAIKRFEKLQIDAQACISQARKFNRAQFRKEVKKLIKSKLYEKA